MTRESSNRQAPTSTGDTTVTDSKRDTGAPAPNPHDDPFGSEPFDTIGEVVKLVDEPDEHGITIAAAATDRGTVAITTVTDRNDAGDAIEPVKTTLQLDPATLIHLAALVPVDALVASSDATVIQLHPTANLEDVVVQENGITNAPCQAPGCERRIQWVPADGTLDEHGDATTGYWRHVPDAYGLTPVHEPIPPADVDAIDRVPEATDVVAEPAVIGQRRGEHHDDELVAD